MGFLFHTHPWSHDLRLQLEHLCEFLSLHLAGEDDNRPHGAEVGTKAVGMLSDHYA